MQLLELNNEVREQEQLPNIDDEGNPLEVAEYVDDIYEYYWIMEVIIITLISLRQLWLISMSFDMFCV